MESTTALYAAENLIFLASPCSGCHRAQAILTVADAESKTSSAIGESLTKDIITWAYVQKLADGTRVIVIPNG